MKCVMCGKEGARLRLLTESYGKGDDLLVIENVPVIQCPSCGESYLTAKTMHQIDEIRRQRGKAIDRTVKVAQYELAEVV